MGFTVGQPTACEARGADGSETCTSSAACASRSREGGKSAHSGEPMHRSWEVFPGSPKTTSRKPMHAQRSHNARHQEHETHTKMLKSMNSFVAPPQVAEIWPKRVRFVRIRANLGGSPAESGRNWSSLAPTRSKSAKLGGARTNLLEVVRICLIVAPIWPEFGRFRP